MRTSRILLFLPFIAFVFSVAIVTGQPSDPASIRRMIDRYKEDPRGPYKDIRWFCKDGTIREARDPCPTELGNQRASYKPEVTALAEKEHIFLGQILATTPKEDFWDAANMQSRLKQYQLEKYLRNIDDGWANRKAQYYRGAMQDEDEREWGIDFLKWLLADAGRVRSHFFLIRQSAKDIPHADEDNTTQQVRALSSEISDVIPSFQEMRVKIHGMPDAQDRQRVLDFREKNKNKINEATSAKFDQLVRGLEKMFQPFRVSDFEASIKLIPKESEAATAMAYFVNRYPTMDCPPEQCQLISKTSLILRRDITLSMSSSARLAMLDISNKMETLLNQEFSRWEIEYLSELLEQVQCLSEAAAAFGFLELWEWDEISPELFIPVSGDTITLKQLSDYSESGRKVAEWSTGMVRAHYMPVIDLFREFEPLAAGFYDDRVRSSVLVVFRICCQPVGR